MSTVVGLVSLGSTATAHAEGLLGPTVRLSASAPTAGQVVSGVRTIEGVADAPEGVSRVDLYVVSHSLTGSTRDSVPVASVTSSLPLSRAPFSFEWDTARTVQGVVDVIVVATTPTTRSAEARVISLQVRNVVRQAKPVATPAAPAKATAANPAPAAPAPNVARPPTLVSRRVVTAAPAQPRRVPSPLLARASADQATAFYAAIGGLVAEPASQSRPVAMTPARDAGRGYAPSVAIALLLLLAAAHTQRAVRVTLAPRD